MAQSSDFPPEDGLSIRVVARLTGINPETLRVWERRYNLTNPARAGMRRSRRYSQADVRRLSAVKVLVDAGHPVSSVANLTLEQLEARMRDDSVGLRTPPGVRSMPISVLVQGGALAALLTGPEGRRQGLEVVDACLEPEEFEARLETARAEVAVIEQSSLQPEVLLRIRRWMGASAIRHWVVVYGFAARSTLSHLEALGVVCIAQPADAASIERACALALGVEASRTAADLASAQPGVPARRFTTRQLARIATHATTIACECPRHLASLVNSLLAFETYSSECASRNERDREMHRVLHTATAQARAQLESALERLIEFEGLTID